MEQEQNKVTWKLRFLQIGNTVGNGALDLGKGALNILSPLALSLPSRTPGANTIAEELAKAHRGVFAGALDKTLWGKAINILDGVGGATLGRTSATETGNFVTDGLNGFVSSMPILSTALAPLGKTIDVYLSDRLKNSLSFNRQSVAMKNNGANVLFGKSSLSAEANLEGIRNAQAEQNLKLGDLDNAADALAVWHRQDMKLRGGPNRVNNFGVTGGKQGTVLQFTKRTLSKHKIRKHQSGSPIDLDSEYLKLTGKPIIQLTLDGNFEIELERTPTYEEWLKNVPEDYRNENYDLKLFYNRATEEKELGNPELWNQLQNWLWAITRPTPEERKFYGDMLIPDENGKLYNPYHLGSILEELDENREPTGNYIFLKLGTEELNPELRGEIDSYHSGENGLVYTHDLVFDGDRYHYKLVNPEKFKDGGKVNVIPEGALHKNKHHLTDIDDKYKDVTTKGIPVIVESEGGEVIQQAEVEREEIIFRLEVTKKLEELSKKHTDEAAIEAGKLLVYEILENTDDNTNNML